MHYMGTSLRKKKEKKKSHWVCPSVYIIQSVDTLSRGDFESLCYAWYKHVHQNIFWFVFSVMI